MMEMWRMVMDVQVHVKLKICGVALVLKVKSLLVPQSLAVMGIPTLERNAMISILLIMMVALNVLLILVTSAVEEHVP